MSQFLEFLRYSGEVEISDAQKFQRSKFQGLGQVIVVTSELLAFYDRKEIHGILTGKSYIGHGNVLVTRHRLVCVWGGGRGGGGGGL